MLRIRRESTLVEIRIIYKKKIILCFIWNTTIQQALRIDEIIRRHSAIMDQYDPQKSISLCVGEWGTWHSVEPGTNPGFLYQQNTIRDALVAGLSLNIFNNHCDRVQMANIAQTINVLQAMVLTEDEKMILTPTYHVFEMYKVHQDATLLPTDIQCVDFLGDEEQEQQGGRGRGGGDFRFGRGMGRQRTPALNVSASRDNSGKIHISICNMHPSEPAKLDCLIHGAEVEKASARVLTASSITAHNTFDNPDVVKPAAFKDFKLNENMLTATLPARSVVVFEVQ